MAKMHQVQLDENNQKVINQISLPEGAEVIPSDSKALAPGEASAGIDDKYARGDHRHPAQVISKGDITKGGEGDITVTTVGLETKINVNFPDAGEVYAAHSDSEEGSEELKELMPDGGIIIERNPDQKPILKQVVEGELVATELSGGVQATYTENAEETESIIDELEEGAIIVEGPGAIVVETDAKVSAEDGNLITKKSDGIYAGGVSTVEFDKYVSEMPFKQYSYTKFGSGDDYDITKQDDRTNAVLNAYNTIKDETWWFANVNLRFKGGYYAVCTFNRVALSTPSTWIEFTSLNAAGSPTAFERDFFIVRGATGTIVLVKHERITA